VLLLGSDHDRADVYAAVDELGATVVAGTHEFGEALLAGLSANGDPLDTLVRHYRPVHAYPAAADVQMAWVRRGDRARGRCRPTTSAGGADRDASVAPYRLDDASRKSCKALA
jgi:hypothetical protein